LPAGPLAETKQNDFAVRKFEGIVMAPLLLLIDLAEDRCLVADYTLTKTERAALAFHLACK
jgi:hypothetical protein